MEAMAPDLNSVPLSPRDAFRSQQASASSSRRASQLMGPPPAPVALPGSAGNGGARDSTHMLSSSPSQSINMAADNTGVGVGPGILDTYPESPSHAVR